MMATSLAAASPPVQVDVLTQEMKDWLHSKIPPGLNHLAKLQRLLQALQRDKDGPRLRYQEGYTATAEEAFATGEVNCLAYSQLVVTMARELGVV